MRALIIETTKLYQEIYAKLLTEQGLDVEVIQSGLDSLSKLNQVKFDIICMSMQLPDIDGPALCSQIRKLAENKNTPLIVFTADSNKSTFEKALISGATEVYHKNEIANFSVYLDFFVGQSELAHQDAGRILYIEDSLAVAQKTIAVLEQVGHSVTHYTNAEQSLDDYLENDYDLVLTDLMLEGKKSGQMLIVDIKNLSGRHAEVPILAVSGLNDPLRTTELLSAGASDYVTKPVLDEELLARVKNLVHVRKLLDKVEQQQAKLHELAMRDQLTKLYNRHFLMDVGPKKVSESCRHGIELSLLVIDLDHFKNINDTHGHATGDIVLSAIGGVLQQSSRSEDIVARFGGEEFVVIYSHCDKDNALNKAELLRKTIEEQNPDGITVTASIGVTHLPDNKHCDFNKLFEAADSAAYKAKQNGRNRVEFKEL